MDKFKEIRPIALGLAIKNNKLLVSEGFDKVKNETFYRCLGGGIEFLEKSEEALKREFLEEINVDITVKNFLGISENIFTYQGKKAHELILFYSIEISDENYQEEYKVIDDHGETIAKWIDIDEFKNKNKILYPKEVFKEWKRLLDKDGRVVYFDANWYLHLFDENQNKKVKEDMKNMEILFNNNLENKEVFAHGNVSSEELMALEEIARQLVLSKEVRPAWDIKALKECGYDIIKVDENMGRYVWDEKQKLENKSRPLFMIVAK